MCIRIESIHHAHCTLESSVPQSAITRHKSCKEAKKKRNGQNGRAVRENSTNLAFFSLELVYKLNINNQKYQNSDHISAVYLFIKYSIAVWCCVLASRGYLEYILSFFLLLRFEQIMGGLFSYKVAKLAAIYPLLIHKSRDKEHSQY